MIPVFMFFPFGSRAKKLVDDVFLILVDIKDIRFIGTGQLIMSLNHATQIVTTSIDILIQGLFFVFIIKELKIQTIEM